AVLSRCRPRAAQAPAAASGDLRHTQHAPWAGACRECGVQGPLAPAAPTRCHRARRKFALRAGATSRRSGQVVPLWALLGGVSLRAWRVVMAAPLGLGDRLGCDW